ncbi:hypothetical protein TNCV_1379041 [Trichonephila clavipes]|nr:hypothetical protein TNCV_1379041 [Trichonephila clavipes]
MEELPIKKTKKTERVRVEGKSLPNQNWQGNRDYTGMWVRLGSTDPMAGKVVFLRGLLSQIRVVDLTVMSP